MPDLTYTANGNFNINGQFSINVCIPAETSNGDYKIALYNMSKITGEGQVNAVFCHFSNLTNSEIIHDGFDYTLNFRRRDLKEFANSVEFDETMDSCLFIFFHELPFEYKDRKIFFDKMERLYEEVIANGNFSRYEDHDKSEEPIFIPRKVGISLIKKS